MDKPVIEEKRLNAIGSQQTHNAAEVVSLGADVFQATA